MGEQGAAVGSGHLAQRSGEGERLLQVTGYKLLVVQATSYELRATSYTRGTSYERVSAHPAATGALSSLVAGDSKLVTATHRTTGRDTAEIQPRYVTATHRATSPLRDVAQRRRHRGVARGEVACYKRYNLEARR